MPFWYKVFHGFRVERTDSDIRIVCSDEIFSVIIRVPKLWS
jgi:hypothetical protein